MEKERPTDLLTSNRKSHKRRIVMQLLKRMVVISVVLSVVAMVVLGVMVNRSFAQATAEAPPTEGEASVEMKAPVEEEAPAVVNAENVNYYMGVVLGAALAAGFGFLGAGYAVARVGAAALGAASERPELLARSIVLVALGEGIAIFGFVVALMLIMKLP